MFELKGVAKGFDGAAVLRGIDLAVPAARTTVLIGPSGCGKSTVLRLMLGLTQPDDGAVTFEGVAVTAESAPVLRRRMGYVIQDGGLFPHLRAGANVALLARWLGWERARIANRLDELGGLTHSPAAALDRYPAELSGGQRQRVGLM